MRNEQKTKKAYAAPQMKPVNLKYRATILQGSIIETHGQLGYAEDVTEFKQV